MSTTFSTRLAHTFLPAQRARPLRSLIAAPPSTRPFRASAGLHDFHFDTHHFVQRLEREGLNRQQAEGIMSAMAEVIDESIRSMTSNMVTKADQEKHQYTQQVDFAQLKSELQLMEKNDLAMIKAESDRLQTDMEKLKQRLREEITRTQAGVRLDLNLEKGRMREESSGQELKIKEVDTRIEQEIANIRTAIQASKATTLQYLVGFGIDGMFCTADGVHAIQGLSENEIDHYNYNNIDFRVYNGIMLR
ncbi:mitochondrial protein [Lanmaoa asiatica]|nr:mitochondrial protein [Lanmaoa asiatica]